jgi:protocatechuate 3,4-dioxygenase beta subunit
LEIDRISRRRALTILGGASLGAVAAACSRRSGSPDGAATSAAAQAGSTPAPGAAGGSAARVDCVLTPEMSEGPFYIPLNRVRSDITEGKQGTPLTLDLTVVDAGSCRPIKDAAVDVWHCDATGEYSGVRSSAQTSFLRGVQVTDAEGKARFETIYPGWYPGRAVHIHVKVSTGGNEVHTGQLFFPDEVSRVVFENEAYGNRGTMDTTNRRDGLFSRGGSESTLKLTEDGDGYTGTLTMGVSGSA